MNKGGKNKFLFCFVSINTQVASYFYQWNLGHKYVLNLDLAISIYLLAFGYELDAELSFICSKIMPIILTLFLSWSNSGSRKTKEEYEMHFLNREEKTIKHWWWSIKEFSGIINEWYLVTKKLC